MVDLMWFNNIICPFFFHISLCCSNERKLASSLKHVASKVTFLLSITQGKSDILLHSFPIFGFFVITLIKYLRSVTNA